MSLEINFNNHCRCAKRRTKRFLDWLKFIQWQRQTAHHQQCFVVKCHLNALLWHIHEKIFFVTKTREKKKRVSLRSTQRQPPSLWRSIKRINFNLKQLKCSVYFTFLKSPSINIVGGLFDSLSIELWKSREAVSALEALINSRAIFLFVWRNSTRFWIESTISTTLA